MKRALVTGGASPLGAAICQRLSGAGLHVIVHAHVNLTRAHEVVEKIQAQGGSAEAIVADLRDMTVTREVMEALIGAGVPQVVVHNAGTHDDVPMAGMSEMQWRNVIEVSLGGFFATVQPLLLPMMRTRWGRIIAVSSVTALLGNRGQANYGAAKAGLIGAVKSLAREVASRGITVNAVAPGIIASPAVVAAMDAKQIAEIVPVRRAGEPAEVADLIAFLASPEAAYITAQVISINGGMA